MATHQDVMEQAVIGKVCAFVWVGLCVCVCVCVSMATHQDVMEQAVIGKNWIEIESRIEIQMK